MQPVQQSLDFLAELAAGGPVRVLAEAFAAAGHELALVGGPVRDAFLGRAITDLDFTTDATPDEILAIVTPISQAQWDAMNTRTRKVVQQYQGMGDRKSVV